ncbi:YdcF family protein [Synechococcus sp. AH-707-B22]|nr:YdcF family protein [Synechococcus sp. AH-707-B22]
MLEASGNALVPSPRILLVTSAFHLRRAQRLFERQGLVVEPFPVDSQARGAYAGPLWRDPTQWFPSAFALDESSRALRELLGRLIYRAW